MKQLELRPIALQGCRAAARVLHVHNASRGGGRLLGTSTAHPARAEHSFSKIRLRMASSMYEITDKVQR